MAARAEILGDVGESGPDHWEKPLGTTDVHVAIAVLSSDEAQLRGRRREGPRGPRRAARDRADLASGLLPARDRADVVRVQGRHRPTRGRGQRPTVRRILASGRSRPARSSWATPTRPGELPPMPTPDVLGRNGTYVVFRKLHTKVAAYRSYLRARAANRAEEDLLGAKMVGRWQSGAPLALVARRATTRSSASDPRRNNDFGFGDDPRGFKCPVGAHARRANPRDALDDEGSVDVRLHRMIRRGTSYGPMLPDGVTEDDGDRPRDHLRLRRRPPQAAVRVRQDPVAQRRHLHRRPARVRPPRRAARRLGQLHDPATTDPPPAAGPAAVRGHPRRGVLLRARA